MVARARFIALPLSILVLSSGCGGSSDIATVPKGAPRPAQSIQTAAGEFEQATGNPTCARIAPLIHSQGRSTPLGKPLAAAQCAALQRNFRGLSGFHVLDSKQFGTGAVVDGKVGRATQAAIFALDVDRKWKFVAATPAAKEVGSSADNSPGFNVSAALAVGAIRQRACRRLVSAVSLNSPLYQAGDERRPCRLLIGPREDRKQLTGQLIADPRARPAGMGGTRDFRFYGIRNRSGRFDTLIMVTQPRDAPPALLRGKQPYGVYDVLTAKPPR